MAKILRREGGTELRFLSLDFLSYDDLCFSRTSFCFLSRLGRHLSAIFTTKG